MGTVNEPLVRLDSVELSYDGAPVLAGVDLTLRAGDFVGVVGPSGAGKTTLLRLALGTLRPTAGRVERARGLRVGYVPQLETVSWSFPVTVAECVLMVRSDRWLPWATRAERRAVTEVLDRLGIAHLADRHIRELSGGQQQRMFLARALLRDPQLLLLDEPTSGIDVATRHEMLHLLGHLHDDGMTILLTTHDLNGVAAHVPDLVAMNGTVLRRGAPADVMTPTVLEQTFGAPMDVLEHLGMPVVLDRKRHPRRPVVETP
jgi:ABC-type Mn2+/Zn2+ transport system ATPase subunit